MSHLWLYFRLNEGLPPPWLYLISQQPCGKFNVCFSVPSFYRWKKQDLPKMTQWLKPQAWNHRLSSALRMPHLPAVDGGPASWLFWISVLMICKIMWERYPSLGSCEGSMSSEAFTALANSKDQCLFIIVKWRDHIHTLARSAVGTWTCDFQLYLLPHHLFSIPSCSNFFFSLFHEQAAAALTY